MLPTTVVVATVNFNSPVIPKDSVIANVTTYTDAANVAVGSIGAVAVDAAALVCQ